MNVVYRSVFTEYEQGWGQRPDGVLYAIKEEDLKKYIKDYESVGSYSCFSRSQGVTQCVVTDEFYKELQDNKTVMTMKNEHPGVTGIFQPTRG